MTVEEETRDERVLNHLDAILYIGVMLGLWTSKSDLAAFNTMVDKQREFSRRDKKFLLVFMAGTANEILRSNNQSFPQS